MRSWILVIQDTETRHRVLQTRTNCWKLKLDKFRSEIKSKYCKNGDVHWSSTHRAYEEFSITGNMTDWFFNIALFPVLMRGLKKDFSLVSLRAYITQDFRPGDHHRAIWTQNLWNCILKQLWNQCADGHLSQVDAESYVLIYILTHFIDLELLLENTLLTHFCSCLNFWQLLHFLLSFSLAHRSDAVVQGELRRDGFDAEAAVQEKCLCTENRTADLDLADRLATQRISQLIFKHRTRRRVW